MSAQAPIALQLDGPLAVVTLQRAPVNAIDEGWLACLDAALAALEQAAGVGVVLVRSTQRIFCAGADLALMRNRFDSDAGRAQFVGFVRDIQRVYARLECLPQVTIAVLGGAALGGGLELALACDLRIAADDATLGLPEAGLGLLPGAGGTQRLTRIAGEAVAKRLILGAETVDGAEAAALGIVHWAVPADALAARAEEIAVRISSSPAAAIAACKRCIGAALLPGSSGYELEAAGTGELLASAETQRRVRAFLERRR